MAHFKDTLYLTERQVKRLRKGKEVNVWREKKRYTLAMKPKDGESLKIIKAIERLKDKLREKQNGKG